MKALLVVVVLAAVSVLLIDSAILDESKERQLNFYRAQVRITTDLLVSEECSFSKVQDEVKNTTADVDELKRLSDQLLKTLIDCRSTRDPVKSTSAPTKPTSPTLKPLIAKPQPTECQNAVNYTEAWRKDHLATDARPKGPHSRSGYACDLSVASNFWFRFTGEAGHQMLNKCPRLRSCGSYVPHWTDEEMPKVVGVETDLKVYGAGSRNCRYFTRTVKAIRCSWDTDYDIIFKQTTNITGNCYYSFCGMM